MDYDTYFTSPDLHMDYDTYFTSPDLHMDYDTLLHLAIHHNTLLHLIVLFLILPWFTLASCYYASTNIRFQ